MDGGMDRLAYVEGQAEYYLGNVRYLSRNGFRNLQSLLSDVAQERKKKIKEEEEEASRYVVPILPQQEKSPEGIKRMLLDFKFDVTDPGETDKDVKIRIRRDNLFIVAYHDGQKWYELSDQDIFDETTESEKLSFNGSYPSMIMAANRALKDVLVGRSQLHFSLRALHHSSSSTPKTVALSLMTIAFMFCETMRFWEVDNMIHDKWSTTTPVGKYLADLVNEWKTESNDPASTAVKIRINKSVKQDDDAAETSDKAKNKKAKQRH